MKRLLFLFIFLLIATQAPAAMYYIDYSSGSDTNAGTVASPWKHHPYMATWGKNPTVIPYAYSHSSGDVFVFKGGVTWLYSSSDKMYPLIPKLGGTLGNPDIYMSGSQCGNSSLPACNEGSAWGSGLAIFDGGQQGERNQTATMGANQNIISDSATNHPSNLKFTYLQMQNVGCPVSDTVACSHTPVTSVVIKVGSDGTHYYTVGDVVTFVHAGSEAYAGSVQNPPGPGGDAQITITATDNAGGAGVGNVTGVSVTNGGYFYVASGTTGLPTQYVSGTMTGQGLKLAIPIIAPATSWSGSLWGAVYGGSGWELSYCTLDPHAQGAFGVANAAYGTTASGFYIHHNTITDACRGTVYGDYSSPTSVGILNDAEIHDNNWYGPGRAMGGYHGDGVMVGCPVSCPQINACTPGGTPPCPPATVTNLLFYNNLFHGNWLAATAHFYSNGYTDNVWGWNNVFAYDNTSGMAMDAFVFIGGDYGHDQNQHWYDNTFSADGSPGYGNGPVDAIVWANPPSNAGVLDFRGNIVSGPSYGISVSGGGTFSSVTIDYNLHNEDSVSGRYSWDSIAGVGTCTNQATCQALGWETHGLGSASYSPTYPGFTHLPDGTTGNGDWSIASSSANPVGHGVDLSSIYPYITTDILNLARPGPNGLTIGAYENGATPATPPGFVSFSTDFASSVHGYGEVGNICVNWNEPVSTTGTPLTLVMSNGSTLTLPPVSASLQACAPYQIGYGSVTSLQVTSVGHAGATVTDANSNTQITWTNPAINLPTGINIGTKTAVVVDGSIPCPGGGTTCSVPMVSGVGQMLLGGPQN